MNKAIAILIILSFLALGGVSIFYYFYYEGLEEVVVTYAKESQPINFKTWVGKNLTEETFVLPAYIGDGFCDDMFNAPLYEYDAGDCCQPLLNIATCYQCKCHKDPDKCPNIAMVGDNHCQPGINTPECDYDGGDCGNTYCLKITQNVAFEFFNFGIFHQFLSY